MTVFDQRFQKVTYQYNANHDINFGSVQNQAGATAELEKLYADLARAVQQGALDEDTGTDAEYHVKKAVQQAKKPHADKNTILHHLNQAKDVILSVAANVAAVTGLAAGIAQAIEMVQKFF